MLAERNAEHYWDMVLSYELDRAQGEEPENLAKLLI
jgi:hypothetical protein